MTIYEDWTSTAYDKDADKKQLKKMWDDYFLQEKAVYEELLANPDEEVKGTVSALAERFSLSTRFMVGFLDGINASLIVENPLEELTLDTEVSLAFDKEKLYKNMVEAGADWLYGLPQWDDIFSKERQAELFHEQKAAHTVRLPKKLGRNDPCHCGSGKKYKNCCMKKDMEERKMIIDAARFEV